MSRITLSKKTIVILILILVILTIGTYGWLSPRGWFSGLQNDLKAIEPEQSLAYTDLDGNPINLNDFKGKPLIMNSWASWTPFSQSELPMLARIQEIHKDKLTILAVNRMEGVPVIRAFLAAYAISPDSLVFITDPADTFYKAVGGYAMPETVLYDKDGMIVTHKRGVLSEEELNSYITALLEE